MYYNYSVCCWARVGGAGAAVWAVSPAHNRSRHHSAPPPGCCWLAAAPPPPPSQLSAVQPAGHSAAAQQRNQGPDQDTQSIEPIVQCDHCVTIISVTIISVTTISVTTISVTPVVQHQ